MRHQFIALGRSQLALGGSQFFFQCLDLVQHLGNAVVQLGRLGLERAGGLGHGVFERLQISQSIHPGHGFDAAHASGHAALAHDLEQANVARGFDVGAAAQLAAGANVEHAYGLAILLTKQHHRAGPLGAFNVHHTRLGRGIGQNFGVHFGFDLADFGVGHGRVVRKVKTGALGVHQAALLLHMAAQHFAQGLVHEVGS